MLVPTIKWENGERTANKIINGIARKIDVILSKTQKITLFSKTPPGAVKTRKSPAINPNNPPIIKEATVIYNVK